MSRQPDQTGRGAPASGDPPTPPNAPLVKADSAELKTPTEWAYELGHVSRGNPQLPQTRDAFDVAHSAARIVHNWLWAEEHLQGDKAFKLSRADYERALEVGLQYPCELRHPAAVPPGASADPTVQRKRRDKLPVAERKVAESKVKRENAALVLKYQASRRAEAEAARKATRAWRNIKPRRIKELREKGAEK